MEPINRARELGRAVHVAREAKGLSIRKLAEQAGITHSFIAKLETGRFQTVSPDNLSALASVLDIPAEDLFALSGYKVPGALPTFGPYLRTRYGEDLPEQAIDSLSEYFELLKAKYASEDGVDDQAPGASGNSGGQR